MSTVLSEYELEGLPEEEATRDIHEFAGGSREYEEELEQEGILGSIAQGLGSLLGGMGEEEMETEMEASPEFEEELEWESEANPIRRVYPDALMEHIAHIAAESESEAEAEAFIGALVPLAAQILPRIAPQIMRAAPRLIRGISRVTRTLRRNPRTRQLVRALPSIMRRTVGNVARQTRAGRSVTPQAVVRTLGRQTRQVLTSPAACRQAVVRSRQLDRRYHLSPAAASRPVVGTVGGGQCACTCCGAPVSRGTTTI
jgi:hypothetical protein